MEGLVNQPRTKRGRATLNNILNAAVQMFYEKGYHAASISDITKLAGVAAGTFYVYFDGKYNLYRYILLQCSHMIRKHVQLATKDCKTRRETERAGLKAWLELTIKNPYIYYVIWESLYVDKTLFINYYASFCAAYVRRINESKKTGEIRDIDSEVMAYMFIGVTSFFGLNWGLFRESDSAEVDHVVDEFMKILDGGIFQIVLPPPLPDERPRRQFRLAFDEEGHVLGDNSSEQSD